MSSNNATNVFFSGHSNKKKSPFLRVKLKLHTNASKKILLCYHRLQVGSELEAQDAQEAPRMRNDEKVER